MKFTAKNFIVEGCYCIFIQSGRGNAAAIPDIQSKLSCGYKYQIWQTVSAALK